MGRKAEERERRRERNRKRCKAVACALGIILFFDIIVFLIAILTSAWDVGAYAFLAVFVIVPPMTWCIGANLDGPSDWTHWPIS